MCLAVPHTVLDILGPGEALAEAGSLRRTIRTEYLESVAPGETVLVHAGFAIEKVDPRQEEELRDLWEEIYRLSEAPSS